MSYANNDALDWISLGDAAKLVPSPRTGRRTHVSTILRWVFTGKLEGRRNGRWWFVRRSQVLTLLRPAGPAPTEQRPPAVAETWSEARTREALAQWGLDKYLPIKPGG